MKFQARLDPKRVGAAAGAQPSHEDEKIEHEGKLWKLYRVGWAPYSSNPRRIGILFRLGEGVLVGLGEEEGKAR